MADLKRRGHDNSSSASNGERTRRLASFAEEMEKLVGKYNVKFEEMMHVVRGLAPYESERRMRLTPGIWTLIFGNHLGVYEGPSEVTAWSAFQFYEDQKGARFKDNHDRICYLPPDVFQDLRHFHQDGMVTPRSFHSFLVNMGFDRNTCKIMLGLFGFLDITTEFAFLGPRGNNVDGVPYRKCLASIGDVKRIAQLLLTKLRDGSSQGGSDPRFVQVFLGGSKASYATWRQEIAIPYLKTNGIHYFNPQRSSHLYQNESVVLNRIMTAFSDVLIFGIAKESRALVSMLEAVEYMCTGMKVLTVVHEVKEGSYLGSELCGKYQAKDINRARLYMIDVSRRHGCMVFKDTQLACEVAVRMIEEKYSRSRDTRYSSRNNILWRFLGSESFERRCRQALRKMCKDTDKKPPRTIRYHSRSPSSNSPTSLLDISHLRDTLLADVKAAKIRSLISVTSPPGSPTSPRMSITRTAPSSRDDYEISHTRRVSITNPSAQVFTFDNDATSQEQQQQEDADQPERKESKQVGGSTKKRASRRPRNRQQHDFLTVDDPLNSPRPMRNRSHSAPKDTDTPRSVRSEKEKAERRRALEEHLRQAYPLVNEVLKAMYWHLIHEFNKEYKVTKTIGQRDAGESKSKATDGESKRDKFRKMRSKRLMRSFATLPHYQRSLKNSTQQHRQRAVSSKDDDPRSPSTKGRGSQGNITRGSHNLLSPIDLETENPAKDSETPPNGSVVQNEEVSNVEGDAVADERQSIGAAADDEPEHTIQRRSDVDSLPIKQSEGGRDSAPMRVCILEDSEDPTIAGGETVSTKSTTNAPSSSTEAKQLQLPICRPRNRFNIRRQQQQQQQKHIYVQTASGANGNKAEKAAENCQTPNTKTGKREGAKTCPSKGFQSFDLASGDLAGSDARLAGLRSRSRTSSNANGSRRKATSQSRSRSPKAGARGKKTPGEKIFSMKPLQDAFDRSWEIWRKVVAPSDQENGFLALEDQSRRLSELLTFVFLEAYTGKDEDADELPTPVVFSTESTGISLMSIRSPSQKSDEEKRKREKREQMAMKKLESFGMKKSVQELFESCATMKRIKKEKKPSIWNWKFPMRSRGISMPPPMLSETKKENAAETHLQRVGFITQLMAKGLSLDSAEKIGDILNVPKNAGEGLTLPQFCHNVYRTLNTRQVEFCSVALGEDEEDFQTMMENMSSVDVFLGGACNPTTWRKDVAEPIFDQQKVSYFNPQVEEWTQELIVLESLVKASSRILLFVLSGQTRAISSMIEVTEYIFTGRDVVLVIQDMIKGVSIQNETVPIVELRELNNARNRLRKMAKRFNIPVFNTVGDACTHICDRIQKTTYSSEKARKLIQSRRMRGALKASWQKYPKDAEGMLTFRGVCLMMRDVHSQLQPIIRGGLQPPLLKDVLEIAHKCGWKWSRWGRLRRQHYREKPNEDLSESQAAEAEAFTAMCKSVDFYGFCEFAARVTRVSILHSL